VSGSSVLVVTESGLAARQYTRAFSSEWDRFASRNRVKSGISIETKRL
jgi:hypothetical protein